MAPEAGAAASAPRPAEGAAPRITQFNPQGRVAKVESIKLSFDAAVVPFGDGQLEAPVDVACNDPELKGEGKWLDGRRWTYVFDREPGPGVQCVATARPDFRGLNNQPIAGKTRFSFQTGGPVLSSHQPYGDTIDEDQVFLLRFNGDVDPDSILAHVHCAVQGLGESVPVRLITGEDRKDILRAAFFSMADNWDTPATQLLQCKRRLPAEARVQLRVGPGVATPTMPGRPAVANGKAQALDYTVRKPFTAGFTCLRERAGMPCTPVSSMAVEFSAPVEREQAARLRLRTPTGEVQPSIDEQDSYRGGMTRVSFKGPFPELAKLSLVLPEGLRDDAGRELANADQFPLEIQTAAFPPLVKFAAAPFGVIERYADTPAGGDEAQSPAAIPLTVRNVEARLSTAELAVSAGKINDYATQDDREALRWYARVQRLEDSRLTANQLKDVMADRALRSEDRPLVDTRGFSALKGKKGVRTLALPGVSTDDPRPFEVIGVPMSEPGFHVLEVESARLGGSLLESAGPMYVRTTALVTNLAVHIKRGRDDIMAWVTTLDDGKVVADAAIAVLDCSGKPLARGKTGADGIWHARQSLEAPDYCEDTGLSGLYVSARIGADHPLAHGKSDFSFAFSTWNRGIESWRFNVPTDTRPTPTMVAHTVMDRTLLRAGETLSMKHFVRVQTRNGLEAPPQSGSRPDKLLIEHQGSDQRTELPLAWKATPSGGLSAVSSYAIPETARLGVYSATLADSEGNWYGSSEFRVEEFKLPLLTGRLQVNDADQAGPLVAPAALQADIQVSYVSGGPAGRLPVSLSGVLRERAVNFPEYDDFAFYPPDPGEDEDRTGEGAAAGVQERQALFLDKQALVLDAQGGGRLSVDRLPAVDRPQSLLFEASFADPNGQIQTLAQSVPVWPAGVQAGLRAGGWVQAGKGMRIQALALSLDGRPRPDAPMAVTGQARMVYSTRKRMVGGFYAYDHHTETRDLGSLCEGRTDARGILECDIALDHPGSIQLIANARDDAGRVSRAASTVWVSGAEELWFGGENDDRIDVIPARKTWKPGETAQFQVRMPFRSATALVAVEREGVLETHVVELEGSDPVFELPVQASWGPNVYVSVLALRGRLYEVPWYSFFSWGWRQPGTWYDAFMESGKSVPAPTAFIDLAKPAFRYGLAEIRVADDTDSLTVKVSADQASYQLRERAKVAIEVKTADGKPAAYGTVAFAAVDQALLELAPNTSWDLLSAMRQLRSYGVETATAQMEVVGRRHYGRKALPAGGGGGKSPTRELLDTLLLWEPSLQLDAEGKATVVVPLNDAITRFKLVAVADYGADRFGTGSASIVSTQDLQVISGLPALVREGDRYQAAVTVRNATQRGMRLEVKAAYSGQGVPSGALPVQNVELAAGAARTVTWPVDAPESNLLNEAATLSWTLEARELEDGGAQGQAETPSAEARSADAAANPAQAGGPPAAAGRMRKASDKLAFKQRLLPAVPLRTRQAVMLALKSGDPPVSLPIAPPPGALPNANGTPRGGLQVHVQSSLGGGLPGVREWFEAYPYTCLEQLGSKAIGLRSAAEWDDLMRRLPDYLDGDGLAAYFPGAAQAGAAQVGAGGANQGNEVLTAYLLAVSHEAQSLGLPFALPDQAREAMARGLLAFVEGRLTRQRWAPQRDLDTRKLMALEALSRYGLVKPRMLTSIAIAPDRWPTSAVIDWLAVLQRVQGIPQRQAQMEQARRVLLARMDSQGTTLSFGAEGLNDAWWLMISRESNAAKLMLTVSGQPQWNEDMPRLAQGLLGMQRNGAWRTTTANLLGSLAMEKFAQAYERIPVSGRVEFGTEAGAIKTLDWADAASRQGVRAHDYFLPWGAAPSDTLSLEQQGRGTAWATLRSLAAVPVLQPVAAGYQVQRSITPVSQAAPGKWSPGDVYRVRLSIRAKAPTTWAVLSDPIPAGASILGSGLGRDSSIAARGESSADPWRIPTFVERSFEAYRAYYDYLPAGVTTVEYTVRLNTVGSFQLPPARIEAMYQPDVYGELPNSDAFHVQAAGAE